MKAARTVTAKLRGLAETVQVQAVMEVLVLVKAAFLKQRYYYDNYMHYPLLIRYVDFYRSCFVLVMPTPTLVAFTSIYS